MIPPVIAAAVKAAARPVILAALLPRLRSDLVALGRPRSTFRSKPAAVGGRSACSTLTLAAFATASPSPLSTRPCQNSSGVRIAGAILGEEERPTWLGGAVESVDGRPVRLVVRAAWLTPWVPSGGHGGMSRGLRVPREGRRGMSRGVRVPRGGRRGMSRGPRVPSGGRCGMSRGPRVPRGGRRGMSRGLRVPRGGRCGMSRNLRVPRGGRRGMSRGTRVPSGGRRGMSRGPRVPSGGRCGMSRGRSASRRPRGMLRG
jgi:hypothetical protein